MRKCYFRLCSSGSCTACMLYSDVCSARKTDETKKEAVIDGDHQIK